MGSLGVIGAAAAAVTVLGNGGTYIAAGSWAMLVLGFGAIGELVRARRAIARSRFAV